MGRTGICNDDTYRQMHETVKEPAMPSLFSRLGCLAALCGLIALGATTAEAAGIGVSLRVHARNIHKRLQGDAI